MSFNTVKQYIEENDTVILYISITNSYAITVVPHVTNKHGEKIENVFQSTYGSLKVMSLVGLPYGSRVQFSKGWGIALYPTPELWTLTLPHRTQILYSTDIAMILGRLNILPGTKVCEAGTGSGSLSHAFLRTIGDEGRLYTSDFHEERVQKALEEFRQHGLSSRVTITRRDVYAEGWEVEGEADAVFMDLPKPWLALHHAVNAIQETGGRICSFSPCIEQVSRTCSLMQKYGLQNIRTVEVLLRTFAVRKMQVPSIDLQSMPQTKRLKEDIDCQENGKRKHKDSNDRSVLIAAPVLKQAGHTGYLTFCFVPPGLQRPVQMIQVVQ